MEESPQILIKKNELKDILKENELLDINLEKINLYNKDKDTELNLYFLIKSYINLINCITFEKSMLESEALYTVNLLNKENFFNKWLDTFVEEKGIDLGRILEVKTDKNTHYFEVGNIVENIKATTPEEQEEIKNMIIKIDFYNGDVVDYFKHLAQALAENYEQQMQKEFNIQPIQSKTLEVQSWIHSDRQDTWV